MRAPFDCRITRKVGVACGRWCVNGTPIFVLRDRHKAGDTIEFLADDFDLEMEYVRIALDFYEQVVTEE